MMFQKLKSGSSADELSIFQTFARLLEPEGGLESLDASSSSSVTSPSGTGGEPAFFDARRLGLTPMSEQSILYLDLVWLRSLSTSSSAKSACDGFSEGNCLISPRKTLALWAIRLSPDEIEKNE